MRCKSHPEVWALGDCACIPTPEPYLCSGARRLGPDDDTGAGDQGAAQLLRLLGRRRQFASRGVSHVPVQRGPPAQAGITPSGTPRPARPAVACGDARTAGHARPQETSCTCRQCSYMRSTIANTNAVDQPTRMIPVRPSIPAKTRQPGPRTTSPKPTVV